MALKHFQQATPATPLSLAPEYTIKPGLLPVFIEAEATLLLTYS